MAVCVQLCSSAKFSQWPVSSVGRLCMHRHLITHWPAWTPSSLRPAAAAAAAEAATL